MTTYSMPTTPGFASASFGLKSNTQTFTSPLSGAQQVVELTGARWYATYTLPPLTTAQAGEWLDFLTKLRGQANTFYGFDPARTSAQGALGGTPLVNGATQTGNSLVTDGWSASVTGVMKAGDYLAYNTASSRSLHMVVADANSDGAGNATFTVEPSIRVSPSNNQAIITASASCVMRLTADAVTWNETTAQTFGITISAEEAL